MGLLDPATSDGRVIFFLPWEGNTIAGTTDSPVELPVLKDPRPVEEEVRWVLNEVSHYLSPDIRVRRGDVLSAWAGVRPLVRDPNATGKNTQALVRNHMMYVSPSGLLTIAGGKWTTYRAMAEETVDLAVKTFGLEDRVRSGCVTAKLRLVGSDGWSPNMFIGLVQRVSVSSMGFLLCCCLRTRAVWYRDRGSPVPRSKLRRQGVDVARPLRVNWAEVATPRHPPLAAVPEH
jgi:glycerol-3-phosphate dehydrogenase